jgi:hypothetical protein
MSNDIDLAYKCTEIASTTIFRDILRADGMEKSIVPCLKLIKLILQEIDPETYNLFGPEDDFVFASSWLITWFSHDIKCFANL